VAAHVAAHDAHEKQPVSALDTEELREHCDDLILELALGEQCDRKKQRKKMQKKGVYSLVENSVSMPPLLHVPSQVQGPDHCDDDIWGAAYCS
jgi:hypothetical protein